MSQRESILSRVAVVMVVIAAMLGAIYLLRHTFSSFTLSFVLAYLFDPFVVFLEKKGCKRTWGIVVLYAILAVFTVFCVTFLIPFITIRWEALLRDIPVYVQKAKGLVDQIKVRYAPAYAAQEWDWLLGQVTAGIDRFLARAGEWLYAAAATMALNIINMVLAPILVFFMLYYKEDILPTLKSFLPRKRRNAILRVAEEVNRSMSGFIRGQLFVSVIVAVLSTAALIHLEVDYPVLNGLFAGLASILPFIGVVLAMLPPLLFAYLKFQEGMILVKVIGAFSVIYFLEGYVVKPLVFKESMDLNPLLTIIMVMAFGELLGFWGIILSIPLAAAMKIFTEHLQAGEFADE